MMQTTGAISLFHVNRNKQKGKKEKIPRSPHNLTDRFLSKGLRVQKEIVMTFPQNVRIILLLTDRIGKSKPMYSHLGRGITVVGERR